ncbi:MAG: exo-alpha-sialidase, partial [bacterium]|nr:exo-alpha-sialidase [bacterium]
ITFTLHSPERHKDNPILVGDNPYTDLDKATAPFSVEHDVPTAAFRMWYTPHSRTGLGYHMGIGTSADGITWDYPDLGVIEFQGNKHNNLVVQHVIGGVVLRDPNPKSPDERYKSVFYRHEPKPVGFSVAFSPDGVRWGPLEWIAELDDSGDKTGTGASDIVNAFYDADREEFVALFKMWSLPGEYSVPVKRGVPAPACCRRIIGMSRSKDFRTWSKARPIVRADEHDPPTLEFYGIPSIVKRGGLYIGFMPCLIDDAPPDGVGWTELIVSRDGDHWHRIRRPFLQRAMKEEKAPDHAIAWITEVVAAGERDHVYYTGLEYGYKIGARSGCLAFLRKNGFVSVDAGAEPGKVITKALRLPAGNCGLTVNANAEGGEIR